MPDNYSYIQIASVIIAFLAFVFSAFATVISVWSRRLETKRQIRSQLMDLLVKLIEWESESQQKRSAADTDQKYRVFQNWWGDTFLKAKAQARLALSMAQEVSKYVSGVEFSIIAETLDEARSPYARQAWEQAIRRCTSDFDMAGFLRGYAGHLFRFGHIDEGRKTFKQALATKLPDASIDDQLEDQATTYGHWANWEEANNNEDKAK
jgi:hypothetical protein